MNCQVTLKTQSKFTILAGVIISLYPILAPYTIRGVSVNWIIGLFFLCLHVVKYKSFPICKATKPVILYSLMSFLLSINGLLILLNFDALLNAEIALLLDLSIYLVLWSYSDIDITMKYANLFAYICCGYAFFQIVMSLSQREVPLGKLPYLSISSGWVNDVWGFRFNSLFSEPSYFAIYLIPIFLYNFLKHKWKNALLFGVFIVLSSSSFGIITLGILLAINFMGSQIKLKDKAFIIGFALLLIAAAGIVFIKIPAVSTFFIRSINKVLDIFYKNSHGSSDSDIRLIGYLYLFDELPIREQLFGVGNSQLQNYFMERGVYIYNYSNSFVLTLLNFGMIGFIIFIVFLINLLWTSRKKGSMQFWLILVMAFLVDSLLFSYRYYWLLYFVLYFQGKMVKYLK